MAYMREVRGPGRHAQLMAGKVTLLGPEHHAAALEAIRARDRKPMSMTHGDFDYDYLERLAVGPDGRRRFDQRRCAVPAMVAAAAARVAARHPRENPALGRLLPMRPATS